MSYCKLCQNDICALLGKPTGSYVSGAHSFSDLDYKSWFVTLNNSVIFACKCCNAQYLSFNKTNYGLPIIPKFITTIKDKNQEWIFICIKCKKD
jgi:hypothetical protein